MPGGEVALGDGPVRGLGDRGRVGLDRAPEVAQQAVKVVDRLDARERLRPGQEDRAGAEEGLDVGSDTAEPAPDLGSDTAFSAKVREGGYEGTHAAAPFRPCTAIRCRIHMRRVLR